MGLDMYLTGSKYLIGNDNPLMDGFPVKEHRLRLGYWRKHPNLHGYIVNTFANGDDECQEIPLKAEDLEQIIEAVCDNHLPHTQGFFFGSSSGTDDEIEDDVRQLQGALNWLKAMEKTPEIWANVIYQASW